MKYFLLIIYLTFSFYGFAQEEKNEKIYTFDYFIEYENTHFDNNLKPNVFFKLTNSKNNSYSATIGETKESIDTLYIVFRHLKKVYSYTKMSKEEFYKAETLNLDCNYSKNISISTKNKNLLKSHKYFMLKDTVIDKKTVKRYMYQSIKKRKRKRKNNIDYIYQQEPNTSFHLPMTHTAYSYNHWLKNKKPINGIMKQEILIYTKTKDTLYVSNLLNYIKYEKKIRIRTDCNE